MGGPELTIITPDFAAAGRIVSIAVEVATSKPLDVQAIEIWLLGVEGWALGTSYRSERFIDKRVEVHGAGTLGTGRHEFTARFALPVESPPSHDSAPAFAKLDVIVSIARAWPAGDVRKSKSLEVRRIDGMLPVRQPAKRSNGSIEDRLDVDIVSSRLVLGETILGSIVASNFAPGQPIEVIAQLVAVTTRHGSIVPDPTRFVWKTVEVVVPEDAGGIAMPFEIPLSSTMPPTFASVSHARDWLLVVQSRGRVFSRPEVAIPLEIRDVEIGGVDKRSVEITNVENGDVEAGESVGAAIGSQRVAAAFARLVADHGWTSRAVDERHAELGILRLSIVREIPGATLELAYSYSAPEGPSVISRVGFQSLQLGLEVSPSSPWKELLLRDIEADDAQWDLRHRVTAHDKAAALLVVREVVPLLLESRSVGVLMRWDDHEIIFARVTNSPPLEQIATDLERIAVAIVPSVPTVPHDGVYR